MSSIPPGQKYTAAAQVYMYYIYIYIYIYNAVSGGGSGRGAGALRRLSASPALRRLPASVPRSMCRIGPSRGSRNTV